MLTTFAIPAAIGLVAVREPIGIGTVYRAIFAALLLWIASIDWRWRIIPNRLVYPAFLAALTLSPLVHPGPLLHAYELAVLGFVLAGGIFLLFFLLSVLIYRHGGAFGLGDVKLAALVGVALGYPPALAAVFFAAFVGALFALGWGVISRDRHAAFPYGPAIAVGAIMAMLIAPTGSQP